MTRKREINRFVFGCIVTCCALALSCAIINKKPTNDEDFVLRQLAYDRINNAQNLIAEGKLAEAQAELDILYAKQKMLDKYELSMVYHVQGVIYTNQQNYTSAAESFEKCLAMDWMPSKAILDVKRSLGQVYVLNSQPDKAAVILKDWAQSEPNPTAEGLFIVAYALEQNKEYPDALIYAEKALAASNPVQENGLQLVLSLQQRLEKREDSIKTLDTLLKLFPNKKDYYLYQFNNYITLNQEKKALEIFEKAFEKKLLTQAIEVDNLVALYVKYDAPDKAVSTLKKSMKMGITKRNVETLKLLANTAFTAKDFNSGITALSEAAGMSTDGNLWIEVADMYKEQSNWQKMADAVNAAIAKGNLADTGNAWLLLGIAQCNSQLWDEAQKSFQEAAKSKTLKKNAKKWMADMKKMKKEAEKQAKKEAKE